MFNPDKDFLYYCALCWQEFDRPEEHAKMKTLDGPMNCPGDIHKQEYGNTPRAKREKPPLLPEAGDPIILK